MTYPFMRQAVDMAVENVQRGGGPFAAIIVRDGNIIATGTNLVTRLMDPTAHAEIVAIREACRRLGDFQLEGCDVYCSCEPCPMCLGALYWARPKRVFFAATHDDAAAAGFDDAFIYRELERPHAERSIPMLRVIDEHASHPFEEWVSRLDKVAY